MILNHVAIACKRTSTRLQRDSNPFPLCKVVLLENYCRHTRGHRVIRNIMGYYGVRADYDVSSNSNVRKNDGPVPDERAIADLYKRLVVLNPSSYLFRIAHIGIRMGHVYD